MDVCFGPIEILLNGFSTQKFQGKCIRRRIVTAKAFLMAYLRVEWANFETYRRWG